MGWFDDNHWAGEAYDFGFGYMARAGYGNGYGAPRGWKNLSRLGDYPAHRNPYNDHYVKGTRKCSACSAFKTTKDFNKEESNKPANRRICNACGPPLPKDVRSLKVDALKQELEARGLSTAGTKPVLITRLEGARISAPPAPAKKVPAPKTKRKAGVASTEFPLVVPDGYRCAPPPPAEVLEFGNASGDALIGRTLLFNWEGVGWCSGVVEQRNRASSKTVGGDVVNFLVYYKVDDELASHNLELEAYLDHATLDGPYGAWVLLEGGVAPTRAPAPVPTAAAAKKRKTPAVPSATAAQSKQAKQGAAGGVALASRAPPQLPPPTTIATPPAAPSRSTAQTSGDAGAERRGAERREAERREAQVEAGRLREHERAPACEAERRKPVRERHWEYLSSVQQAAATRLGFKAATWQRNEWTQILRWDQLATDRLVDAIGLDFTKATWCGQRSTHTASFAGARPVMAATVAKIAAPAAWPPMPVQQPAVPRRLGGEVRCPWPQCHGRIFKAGHAALRDHCKAKHGGLLAPPVSRPPPAAAAPATAAVSPAAAVVSPAIAAVPPTAAATQQAAVPPPPAASLAPDAPSAPIAPPPASCSSSAVPIAPTAAPFTFAAVPIAPTAAPAPSAAPAPLGGAGKRPICSAPLGVPPPKQPRSAPAAVPKLVAWRCTCGFVNKAGSSHCVKRECEGTKSTAKQLIRLG